MTLRGWLKYIYYAYRPFGGGSFSYFGTQVYLPPRSLMLRYACEQGIYELDNVEILRKLARPGTWYFDVGTHLGYMSLPLLHYHGDLRVASFEVSPNSLPYLLKTHATAPFKDRWEIVPRAVGAREGTAEFSVSPHQVGFLDGLKATGRADGSNSAVVPITTLDAEWSRLGRPEVSILKIDIEGGELPALRGGQELLKTYHPCVLLEWQALNFAAYGTQTADLLTFAGEFGYRVYSSPHLIPIVSLTDLKLQMVLTESFLLAPIE